MGAHVMRDDLRIERIRRALHAEGLDAIVCGHRANVRLLTGYWPVIGNALAVATRDGAVALIVPEDERELSAGGWADPVLTFDAGSLDTLITTVDAVPSPLEAVGGILGVGRGTVLGFDGGAAFDPSGYASTFTYGRAMEHVLHDVFPECELRDASEPLGRLRAVLTPRELDRLRAASAIARAAYEHAAAAVRPGMTEIEIARCLEDALAADDHGRCDGFAYCMSGPNSALAYAAFQRSRSRTVADGDFVLLHCNSYCDGTPVASAIAISSSSPRTALSA